MPIKTGTRFDLRTSVGYRGTYTSGPMNWTARLRVASVASQTDVPVDPADPLTIRPNRHVELVLEEPVIVPRGRRLYVEVHEELHARGVVRTRTSWEAGEQVRIYFTATRLVDLSTLAWHVSLRATGDAQ